MHVIVISPEAAIFDGEADAVTAPAYDGSLGVLPRHAPMMTLLGQGELAVRQGEQTRRFTVRGGFLQVVHDEVRVVAEHVQETKTDA
jgi:F-type H+-transporting ATPase subunit epsilon